MNRIIALARRTLAAITPTAGTLVSFCEAINAILLVVGALLVGNLLGAMIFDSVDRQRLRTAEVDGRPDPRTVVLADMADAELAAMQAEVAALQVRAAAQDARLLDLLTKACIQPDGGSDGGE